MELSKAIETLWPYLTGAAIPLVAWFVRLEAKVESQSREIESVRGELREHKEASKEKNDKLWETMNEFRASLSTMLQALGRIEGKLEKE